MADTNTQKAPLIKSKLGTSLGFRTSDHFRATRFGGGAKLSTKGFNPAQFKTQHKGG